MALQARLIEYEHNGDKLEAYFAWDNAIQGERPGVLVAHPWAGRNADCEAVARQLAEMGYAGFALDMYGKGVLADSREECARLMELQTRDRQALQARMLKALEMLQTQPEVKADSIAAWGYCFGGLCVLDLARTGTQDVRGVVSFHGLLHPPEQKTTKRIQASILVLHGHEDPMAPPDSVSTLKEELTQAQADWQIHVFGQAMHAFTNPNADDKAFGTVYDARAAQRSWTMAVDFLTECLRD